MVVIPSCGKRDVCHVTKLAEALKEATGGSRVVEEGLTHAFRLVCLRSCRALTPWIAWNFSQLSVQFMMAVKATHKDDTHTCGVSSSDLPCHQLHTHSFIHAFAHAEA
eukprot:1159332-Pelagomonas_calceolata.AAC.3